MLLNDDDNDNDDAGNQFQEDHEAAHEFGGDENSRQQ